MTSLSKTLPANRVFSGMQPTGSLHLGNYLGAMINWIAMQDSHECIYCIVDLHAITLWQDPAELRQSIRKVTAAYIASGLDPKKSILFNQSQVPMHAELAWVFNCVARLGWLDRMTQFKDKAGKDKQRASVGLYVYPNLMAADILAYRATHVPVGEDQKQHLELTRDIAQKFNSDYADEIKAAGYDNGFFPLPEPVIQGAGTRVMSLRDGSKKMSKSDPSELSRINISDDADTIAKKIRKAKTDPGDLPSDRAGLEGRPEAQNLIGIFAALSGSSTEVILKDFGGGQFSQLKKELAELAVAKLAPIADEIAKLESDPLEIDRILADGAARAREISAPVLDQVKDIVGLLRS